MNTIQSNRKDSTSGKRRLAFRINRTTVQRGIRISIGMVVSILVAQLAGLQFAPSTGIVTLLGIQNTRKETIQTSLRRIISFAYTILISYLIYTYIGLSTLCFALVVIVITMITVGLEWQDTLSINIVVAIHLFMQQQQFTSMLIANEAGRVLIGMLTAILVNWHHPTSEEKFESMITRLELQLQQLLLVYSRLLLGQASYDELTSTMISYKNVLEYMKQRANQYSNNHLSRHAGFYESYMCMREQECLIFDDVISHTRDIQELPESAAHLGTYIRKVSELVSVREPIESWTISLQALQERLEKEPLPLSYQELKDKAAVLSVVSEITKMIHIKYDFMDSLSETQRKHYITEMN